MKTIEIFFTINKLYKLKKAFERNEFFFKGNCSIAKVNDWGQGFSYLNLINREDWRRFTDSVLARLGEIVYFKSKAVFLLIVINDLWNNYPSKPSL